MSGAMFCPSTIHEKPVEGTVRGMFRNVYNPANNTPVTYCDLCAKTGEAFGLFTPDAIERGES